MARVLAFDIALRFGWSVVDDGVLVASGYVLVKGKEIGPRYLNAYSAFAELLDESKPDFVAAERVNFSRYRLAYGSYRSLRAVLLLACEERGLDVVEVDVKALKEFWAGKGSASKADMCEKARRRTGVSVYTEEDGGLPGEEDQADAIAVGFWADEHYET
jgi:crossover junction endodeoxyribonuclease RuvC